MLSDVKRRLAIARVAAETCGRERYWRPWNDGVGPCCPTVSDSGWTTGVAGNDDDDEFFVVERRKNNEDDDNNDDDRIVRSEWEDDDDLTIFCLDVTQKPTSVVPLVSAHHILFPGGAARVL